MSLLWSGSPLNSQLSGKARRYVRPAIAVLALLLCIWYLTTPGPGKTPRRISRKLSNSRFVSAAPDSHPKPKSTEALEFWRSFSDTLAKIKPSFAEVKRVSDHSPWVIFDRKHQTSKRPELIELPKNQLEELQRLRKQAISEFGAIAPQLPFARGTRGIITTANNDALPILTTSLWVLRAAGSTLPVEVWFYGHDSWEEEPCNVIFPSLGAECMFMEDYLPKDLAHPLKPGDEKYIYKPLAMVFSTFEQALFLDCDAFPVMNPDSIFDTEPFTSHGIVLWPDYWASTASKYFYDINGREVPDLKKMATAESGQLLMNKATHSAPILLSVWYNTYGPKYWYRLLSQKAPGEGDKDTYLPAVRDYGLPWYQVYESPQRVGYKCEGSNRRPVGSAQSHPLDDYRLTSKGIIRHGEGFDLAETFHPRILFIHGNLPKYDPYILLDWDIPKLDWQDMLRCDEGLGEAHRMWGPKDLLLTKYGWDVERAVWDAMRWQACVHEQGYNTWTKGSIWRPEETLRHDLCSKMQVLWKELFPGETFVPEPPKIGRREERPWGGWNDPQI